MKSQLKTLISSNITSLESDLGMARTCVRHFYKRCDKDDQSDDSKYNFDQLNDWKAYKKRLESKLKKLRAMQIEVKVMSSYTTTKTKSDVINGKAYVMSIITTKEV